MKNIFSFQRLKKINKHFNYMSLLELRHHKKILEKEKKKLIGKDNNKIKKFEERIKFLEKERIKIEEEEKNDNVVYLHGNYEYVMLSGNGYKKNIEKIKKFKNSTIEGNDFIIHFIVYEKSVVYGDLVVSGFIFDSFPIHCTTTIRDLKNIVQNCHGISKYRLTFYNIETNTVLEDDKKIKLYPETHTKDSIFTIKMYIEQTGFVYPDRYDIKFLLGEIKELRNEIHKLKNEDDIIEAELISGPELKSI